MMKRINYILKSILNINTKHFKCYINIIICIFRNREFFLMCDEFGIVAFIYYIQCQVIDNNFNNNNNNNNNNC